MKTADIDNAYGPISTSDAEHAARSRAANSVQTSIFARLRSFGPRRSAISWDVIFLARAGDGPTRAAKAGAARLRLASLDVTTLTTIREAARGARKAARDIDAVCMADDAISALSALLADRGAAATPREATAQIAPAAPAAPAEEEWDARAELARMQRAAT